MKISVCIGYTNRVYQNMARVAARSVKQHTPGATIRLVRCQNKGYRQNMGTRFEAYVDESADWVSAMDADSLCFGDIGAIVQRAEHEGWDFLGRLSGRPRKAPRTFDRRRYERLFRDAGHDRIAVHVPNAFLVRGRHSARLAELAARWTERLYEADEHVLGRPLWSDQVGFTLGLASLGLPDADRGLFLGREVANWSRARRMSSPPKIVHFGANRWRRLWATGRLLGLMR